MKRKITILFLSILMILTFIPCVSAYAGGGGSVIDIDTWNEYFFNSYPEKYETAKEVYFGEKSDFTTEISELIGESLSLDDNIKVYEDEDVYYIVSEDDGIIRFPSDSAGLFSGMGKLDTIDFSDNVNTSAVTSFESFFSGCEALLSIDLSSLNFNSSESFSYMFEECEKLETITWPASVTITKDCSLSYMFMETALSEVDLSGFTFGEITDLYRIFNECENLTSVKWPTTFTLLYDESEESYCGLSRMFEGSGITEVDLTIFNNVKDFFTNEDAYLYSMFDDCLDLVKVKVPSGFDMSGLTGDNEPYSEDANFDGWYYESSFITEYDGEDITVDTWLYPKWDIKEDIDIDLTAQTYTLESSDDIATFEIKGTDSDLDGFEITYYIDWYGSEATSESGVTEAGDFEIQITREADETYKAYDSGRITDALHVNGVIVYDDMDSTGGEAPVDNNIYEKDDTVTVLSHGSLVRKGYTFKGWIYGDDWADEGEEVSYSGTTFKAYWVLTIDPPTMENDYTLTVDTDEIDNLNWYCEYYDTFTLTEEDLDSYTNGLFLSYGEFSEGTIKSVDRWEFWVDSYYQAIDLSVYDDLVAEGDSITFNFGNLPENYTCEVNGEEVTIVDNKLTVVASEDTYYQRILIYGETREDPTTEASEEEIITISSVVVNGRRVEKLAGEDGLRLNNVTKSGTYYVRFGDYDAMYGMYGTTSMGYVDSVKYSFNNNGGYGTVEPIYNIPGRTITLPSSDSLSILGYKLVSWNTKADGTGESYAPNSKYTVGEDDTDTTFYAIWQNLYYDAIYTWNDDHTVCTALKEYRGDRTKNIEESVKSTVTIKDGKTVYTVAFTSALLDDQTYTENVENSVEVNVNNEKVTAKANLLKGTLPLNSSISIKQVDVSDVDSINEKLDENTEAVLFFEISLNDAKGNKLENIDGNTYGITITIPEELRGRDSYTIICISDDGTIENFEGKLISDSEVYFETTHFSTWALVASVEEVADDIAVENVDVTDVVSEKDNSWLIYVGIAAVIIIVVAIVLSKKKQK